MKTSKVLKHAKKHLAKNRSEIYGTAKEEYICFSVNSVYSTHDKCGYTDRDRVKNMISDRLGDHSTLEDWLEEYHGIKSPDWDADESEFGAFVDKMQHTRHAWIDSMIAEFAAKGD